MLPIFNYFRMLGYAYLFAAQDIAIIAALPLLERLLDSGRLDALVERRVLVLSAELACKESV